ncbi:MAG: FliM/FliN family flagellar motor C-terminal domain-containing protein [Planctomycetaceae bacterium]|jgi:flagellar motor switch/type III secretory pathway protein FliN|nr:FliM/FliN family flagellar motor C-terminal domain-containing protein [Planctomycetaceae bacterium]
MQEQGQESIAESQRMLEQAVADLNIADSSGLSLGLDPYPFEDWSDSNLSKTNPCFEGSQRALGLPSFVDSKTTQEDQSQELRIEVGKLQILPEDLYVLRGEVLLLLDTPEQQLADLYVDQHRLAKGEVLCLEGRICFRVVEIVDPKESLP